MNETAVAVVGDGVVGLACALNIRRSGANVVVFGADSAMASASIGNAGHIAIEQVEPLASPAAIRSVVKRLFVFGGALDFVPRDAGVWMPWAIAYVRASTPGRFLAGRRALGELMVEALPAWRRLVSSINAPALLKEEGHIVLWEERNSARAGIKAWTKADTGLARFEPLAAGALRQIGNSFKPRLAGGIRFNGTAQISDPGQLVAELRQALGESGVDIRPDRAVGLSKSGSVARLVLESAGVVAYPHIVIAAGVGSAPLMRSIGHRTPLIAERGYHIEGPAGHWPDLPPIVFQDRSMIVTRFGDRLRAASFIEFGGAATPPDPRKWDRLRQHLQALGLPIDVPWREWMGARPTLPDYLPAIGTSTRASNLIYAFAHQHLGLTLAATTGEIVAQLIAWGRSSADIGPFNIERFDRGRT